MDEMGYALGASPEWDEEQSRRNLDWLSTILLFALFSNKKRGLDEIADMVNRLKHGDEECVKEMLANLGGALGK